MECCSNCGRPVELLYRRPKDKKLAWYYYDANEKTLHTCDTFPKKTEDPLAEKLTEMLAAANEEKIRKIAREEIKKILLDITERL